MSDHGFKDFEFLRALNISTTRLDAIKVSWFDRYNVLENLDLSHNSIEFLTPVELRNLPKLKILNVSHNYIKSIEPKTFAHMTLLETLDLSFNLLQSIAFGEVPKLKALDLQSNLLEVVCMFPFI